MAAPALQLVAEHISPLHLALGQVRRVFDAAPINRIVNHPAVRPHLGGEGDIDVTGIVQNPNNVVLHSNGFAAIFLAIHPGLYDVHTQALPEARGEVVARASQACLHWLFSRTDAVEVLTKVPVENEAAAKLCAWNNFEHDYTIDHDPTWGGMVDVLAVTLQRWMARAPGLAERGAWFHREVDQACRRDGVERAEHPDDPLHDRYAGAACELALGGQMNKAALFYNRWAAMAGYRPIAPISATTMFIGDMAIAIDGEHVEIVRAQ